MPYCFLLPLLQPLLQTITFLLFNRLVTFSFPTDLSTRLLLANFHQTNCLSPFHQTITFLLCNRKSPLSFPPGNQLSPFHDREQFNFPPDRNILTFHQKYSFPSTRQNISPFHQTETLYLSTRHSPLYQTITFPPDRNILTFHQTYTFKPDYHLSTKHSPLYKTITFPPDIHLYTRLSPFHQIVNFKISIIQLTFTFSPDSYLSSFHQILACLLSIRKHPSFSYKMFFILQEDEFFVDN